MRVVLDIFTLVYPFSSLSPSLWETARYRLKYCLKGPLNPKQPTKIDVVRIPGLSAIGLGANLSEVLREFVFFCFVLFFGFFFQPYAFLWAR